MSQNHTIGSVERTPPSSQPSRHDAGAIIGGLVLVTLGVIFLLQQWGILYLRNWWALFVLIPAMAAFGKAWTEYRAAGDRVTSVVGSSVIGGSLMVLITIVLLLDLGFDRIWPIFLIVGGVALLINARLHPAERSD